MNFKKSPVDFYFRLGKLKLGIFWERELNITKYFCKLGNKNF